MPPAGRKGARGGGRGGATAEAGGSEGGKGTGRGGGEFEQRRGGAGRGIPDYKENPRAGAKGGAADGEGAAEGAVTQKFNAQEAADWMASRYQAVVDEYEKAKASGRKAEIFDFSKDLNQSA